MKKDLAIAMAIAKKNKKKMAKGGDVSSYKLGPKDDIAPQAKMHPDLARRAREEGAKMRRGGFEGNIELAAEHEARRKSSKSYAKGGPVDTAETVVIPDRGYGKIIRTGMAKGGEVKGVHTSIGKAPEVQGKSAMGSSSRAGKARLGESAEVSKEIARDEAKRVTEEARKMPKPKLQGLARGGMVESNLIKAHPLDAIGQILKDHEAHLESQLPPENETEHMDYNDEHALHSKDMAEGGEVDEYGYPIKPPAPPAPRLDQIKASASPKPMKPKDKSLYDYAEGGQVMEDHDMMKDDDDDQPEPEAEDEDHASIASAIMAKRAKYAEGGAVDIDENAEEQSNMYYKLNQATLKENYDSDMDDVSQPMDSNEDGDSIDADDHDRISIMRRKMALKRMAK